MRGGGDTRAKGARGDSLARLFSSSRRGRVKPAPSPFAAFLLSREWRDRDDGIEIVLWARAEQGPVRARFPGQEAVMFVPRGVQTRAARQRERPLATLHGAHVGRRFCLDCNAPRYAVICHHVRSRPRRRLDRSGPFGCPPLAPARRQEPVFVVPTKSQRRRTGIEPARDDIRRLTPVLKTGDRAS